MSMKHTITLRIGQLFLCTAVLLLGRCCPADRIPQVDAGFQKGLNYTAWARGQLSTAESDRALANLADTGANWVSIVIFGYQETYTSTAVTRDPSRTASDADVIRAVDSAHELGVQVMLKPHVDLRHDPDHWRGNIGESFTDEAQWQEWFESYRTFITHYATLAQENGVEQFCVGTELVGTSHREAEWREIVADVRERYERPVTYAGNHGTEDVDIAWWDAVDLIGVDAYYVLTDKTDPTVEELKAAWVERGYFDTLAGLAQKHGKQILITEIGYRSADGTIRVPWDWNELPLDLQEQADGYQAALEVFWGQPWLAGIYWWNWDVNPQKGGVEDTDYTPYGKPAEEVIRTYYGGAPQISIRPTSLSAAVLIPMELPAAGPAFAPHPGWTSFTATGHVNDLAFDRDGNLWIATPGGLLLWNIAHDTVVKYTTEHGLADNWVEMVEIDPVGRVWAGTSGGISRQTGTGWHTYDAENGLPCNGVTDIAFAQNGDTWVSTFGCGVARFDGQEWMTYDEKAGLLESHVLCVTAATDGTVLFGTWAGVSQLDGHDWFTYKTDAGLTHHGVEAITEDHDGALWIGTWEGMSRLNNTIWTAYGPGEEPGWVESIAIAPDGVAWTGTRDGVYCFSAESWSWDAVLSIASQPDERGVSIAIAPDGAVWVGTYDGFIYRFDGTAWGKYALASNLPSNKVVRVAVDSDSAVWVKTGPDRYDRGGGTWRFEGHTWVAMPDDAWADEGSAVPPDSTAWTIIDGGVSHFDGARWTTYTSQNGLIGDSVNGMAIDPSGIVWVATDDGLSRFSSSP
jgi:ligand-binding sensor domain-containing protein